MHINKIEKQVAISQYQSSDCFGKKMLSYLISIIHFALMIPIMVKMMILAEIHLV